MSGVHSRRLFRPSDVTGANSLSVAPSGISGSDDTSASVGGDTGGMQLSIPGVRERLAPDRAQ